MEVVVSERSLLAAFYSCATAFMRVMESAARAAGDSEEAVRMQGVADECERFAAGIGVSW